MGSESRPPEPSGSAALPTPAGGGRPLLPVLAELPGHLLWRASARVNTALAELSPSGVDLHAYAALLALAGGATRSQQELADIVGVSRTTMTRVGAALVEQGLVERVRNPADRRSYALTRTSAGAEAARRWQSHAEVLRDSLASGFSEAEHAELVDLLLKVAGDEVADDTPPALRHSLALLVIRVHAAMHRLFLPAMAPLGLQPRMFGSLTALSLTGPIAQADLARALGTSAAHVVAIADDLEAAGLVERRRDPDDRRTQLLHPTPRVPRTLELARQAASEADRQGLRALDARERRRLVRLLQRFVTAP